MHATCPAFNCIYVLITTFYELDRVTVVLWSTICLLRHELHVALDAIFHRRSSPYLSSPHSELGL
jgi:hypothetical protein